jgi:hypothetical protein
MSSTCVEDVHDAREPEPFTLKILDSVNASEVDCVEYSGKRGSPHVKAFLHMLQLMHVPDEEQQLMIVLNNDRGIVQDPWVRVMIENEAERRAGTSSPLRLQWETLEDVQDVLQHPPHGDDDAHHRRHLHILCESWCKEQLEMVHEHPRDDRVTFHMLSQKTDVVMERIGVHMLRVVLATNRSTTKQSSNTIDSIRAAAPAHVWEDGARRVPVWNASTRELDALECAWDNDTFVGFR